MPPPHVGGLYAVEERLASHHHAGTAGRVDLVPAQAHHVQPLLGRRAFDGQGDVGGGLRGVDHHERSGGVRHARDGVDGVDDARDVGGGGDGDVVEAVGVFLDGTLEGGEVHAPGVPGRRRAVARGRRAPELHGHVHHAPDVLAMRQVVGVVLHDGGDDGVALRPLGRQDARHAVEPARHAVADEDGRVVVPRAHEVAHHVVRPVVEGRHDARAEVQLRVRVGVVRQRLPGHGVGRAQAQVGGGAVEVDAPRGASVGERIARVEAVEGGAEGVEAGVGGHGGAGGSGVGVSWLGGFQMNPLCAQARRCHLRAARG